MKKKSAIFSIVALGALLMLGVYTKSTVFATFSSDEAVRVNIPIGTENAMADTLVSKLGEDYAAKVIRLWRWQTLGSKQLPHGSFVVRPGATAFHISRMLFVGNQTPVKVTFNNIRTIDVLADRIAAKMEFDKDAFLTACDSVLSTYNFTREQYAAAFLPDTYEFYWTESPERLVQTLVNYRNSFWSEERMKKANSLGLTPVEAAVVASIVEEETSKADERPLVARLYLNRLKRKMPLQADPTIKFALGDFSLKRITHKHLEIKSPYNTYSNLGLPPGPIRIPEKATIDAVLSAPEHDYVYMCAKADFSGYHNFASTYDRHRINAARYHAALNKRGIK